MIKSLLLFLTSSASLALVVDGNRPRAVGLTPSDCFACSGCSATQVQDPNAIPPITNGVQILSQATGVKVVLFTLTATSGRCQIVTGHDGLPFCGPMENCRFQADYTISSDGSIGSYHNNGVPCKWSQPIGGFNVLADSISWLAACDNTQSWATVECYNNATSCNDGASVVKIKFVGRCGSCNE